MVATKEISPLLFRGRRYSLTMGILTILTMNFFYRFKKDLK
jgi:hypothetical protein